MNSKAGYTLAKFDLEGSLIWNVFHNQGYDINMTNSSPPNPFRNPWVKVSPDESFVAFWARLETGGDSTKSWEAITLYNTSDGSLIW